MAILELLANNGCDLDASNSNQVCVGALCMFVCMYVQECIFYLFYFLYFFLFSFFLFIDFHLFSYLVFCASYVLLFRPQSTYRTRQETPLTIAMATAGEAGNSAVVSLLASRLDGKQSHGPSGGVTMSAVGGGVGITPRGSAAGAASRAAAVALALEHQHEHHFEAS